MSERRINRAGAANSCATTDYGTPCRDCGHFDHTADCLDIRDRREEREDKARDFYRGAK